MRLAQVDLGDYAGFMPGLAVSIIVSLIVAGRAARALGVPRSVAWTMLMAVGLIISATLTPSREALEYGTTSLSPGSSIFCDLTRIGPLPPGKLLSFTEASLNVILFVPLGVAIGLVPRSGRKAALVLAAVGLPFAVETIQLLVPLLGRACESADVADNVTGLVLGLAVGTVAGRLLFRPRRRIAKSHDSATLPRR